MMAVARDPARIKALLDELTDIQIEVFEELWQLVSPALTGVEGSIQPYGCWSPGRTMGIECDVSCMVSPSAYKELFLPPLVEIMRTVDHRAYHLDGPGALKHLDTLLGLPELDAIQWVPGAGREEITQWIPLLQHIQAGGKAVLVHPRPQEVEPLLRELRPEGLCMRVECETEGEARELVELVTRLSG
jgi:hypothetical protein